MSLDQQRSMISVLTPAFNESANIEQLYERLVPTLDALGVAWEWLIVDDHSRDDTFAIVRRLAARDGRVRGIRLARNAGSHVAIACALHHASGDAAVMLAGDLQDPPETIRAMLERWRAGAQVVWAVRRQRPGERTHAGFAAVYYWLMRHVIGLTEMPSRGADFFLVDRHVIDAFRHFPERNVSVLALITWLGFRQEFIDYDKQPRAAGQSGWTLARKVRLVVDSIAAFSDLPVRLCWVASAALFVISLLMLIAAVAGVPAGGRSVMLILAAVFGVGGLQMIAVAVVGEYAWRAYDEARRRPQYLVEATTANVAPAVPGGAAEGDTTAAAVRLRG